MKIRGATVATPIARHAVTGDTIVSKKPWSSKNTVDKLCPAFTETGAIVTCEPVEGYPLQVEPVNLIKDTEYLDSSKWVGGAVDGGYQALIFPLGDSFVSGQYCFSGSVSKGRSVGLAYSYSGKYVTLSTGVENFKNVVSVDFPDDYSQKQLALVLEEQTIDSINYIQTLSLSVTPTKIFRTGKNLVNSNVLDANNVTWHKYSAETRYRYYLNLAPGTYTASVKRIGTKAEYLYLVSNFGNGYLEENMNVISGNNRLISGSGTERTCTFNVRSGESVALYAVNNNVSSFVEWIQVEAGSPKTDYEPYQGGEFAPGEAIPALHGANYLWADVGEITVTGRKDPVAIIEKLTKAVDELTAATLSMGSNV